TKPAGGFTKIPASTLTAFTDALKSAARLCCCSRAYPSRPSAIPQMFPTIRCLCSPIGSCPAFPTSFLWAGWCWVASGGSPIGAKKWPRRRVADASLKPVKTTGGHDENQVDLLEAGLPGADGCRVLCDDCALYARSGSRHQFE